MTAIPHPLLGLSESAALPYYVLVGLYFALLAYLAFGNWTRKDDCQAIQPWQMYAFPVVAFVVLWLCGRPIWFISLWLWGGDLFAESANAVSVLFALVFSGILLTRLATKWVSRSYLRINAWDIGLCVVLLSAVYLLDIANHVDGWTARGAAEKKFAHLMKPSKFYPEHLPRRIEEETAPELAARGGKAFTLYIGEYSAAELHVLPYYRWWWTAGYFRATPFAGQNLSTQEQIERLRESLKK
jgi:hypothetical protein